MQIIDIRFYLAEIISSFGTVCLKPVAEIIQDDRDLLGALWSSSSPVFERSLWVVSGWSATRLILDVSMQLSFFQKQTYVIQLSRRKEKSENTLPCVKFIFAASRLLMPKTPQVTIFSFD